MPKDWVRLDNAAKIYPAARSRRWSALFRLSATLDEPVDPDILTDAVYRLKKRFPTFYMKLKRGAFWYYMERTEKCPKLRQDEAYPCAPLVIDKNRGFSFRVRYYKNRIAVEFFHVLTDGTGGLIFLETLVAEYLSIKYGVSIPRGEKIFDCNDDPAGEEMEDSFLKNTGPVSHNRREADSYRIRGEYEPDGYVNLTTGTIPADALISRAHEKNVSVTAYLTAVMIDAVKSLQDEEIPRKRQKPVKISVPVNLRGLFKSSTLRNFASYVNPGIDPRMGDYTFDEILKIVHHCMGSEITAKQLSAKFTANVASERNPFLRVMPLFIKNMAMKMVFMSVGDKKTSTIISNLGNAALPEEMKKHVKRMEFILGPLSINPVACSAISYDGTLYFNITRTIKEPKLEHAFFTRLVELGIPVEIESNRRS